jgi:hypothetical protein
MDKNEYLYQNQDLLNQNFYKLRYQTPEETERELRNKIIVKRKVTFKQDFGLILVGAIIFVASFLWKDLLTDIEEIFFPKSAGIIDRILYVVIVTLLLLLLASYVRFTFGLEGKPVRGFDDSPLNADPGADSGGD